MEFPQRFANLPEYAFPRLRTLLGDRAAGNSVPVDMTIGSPRHDAPDFVVEEITRHADRFKGYPPNEGAPELLDACLGWLARRFGVDLAPENLLVLNGTREGLFNTCLALAPETKNGAQPAVLSPNPFYQVYAVAALTAGAEPIYVNATEATGNLPDFASLGADVLDRVTVAYICSPANPQGAVADRTYWERLLDLAARHDFLIFADECYSEIFTDTVPTGILQVAETLEHVVAFHSLSKRSNLAGLRSGFAVSSLENIKRMRQLRAYAGAPLPYPLQMAAARAWRDEAHVEASRDLYRQKFKDAAAIFADVPQVAIPEVGFFLWLPVEDGEAATLTLWEEDGIKVLPGAYLARDTAAGNPGQTFIRVALVGPVDETREALTRLKSRLYL